MAAPASLQCTVCGQLLRRASRLPCCGVRCCWNCGVREITRTRACWAGCPAPATPLPTTALQQDTQTRIAVRQWQEDQPGPAFGLVGSLTGGPRQNSAPGPGLPDSDEDEGGQCGEGPGDSDGEWEGETNPEFVPYVIPSAQSVKRFTIREEFQPRAAPAAPPSPAGEERENAVEQAEPGRTEDEFGWFPEPGAEQLAVQGGGKAVWKWEDGEWKKTKVVATVDKLNMSNDCSEGGDVPWYPEHASSLVQY